MPFLLDHACPDCLEPLPRRIDFFHWRFPASLFETVQHMDYIANSRQVDHSVPCALVLIPQLKNPRTYGTHRAVIRRLLPLLQQPQVKSQVVFRRVRKRADHFFGIAFPSNYRVFGNDGIHSSPKQYSTDSEANIHLTVWMRSHSTLYPIFPPTIVATTFPVYCLPSNGVLCESDRDLAASNVQRFLGSKIVTSAKLPLASDPRPRRSNTRAGPAEKSSTIRVKGILWSRCSVVIASARAVSSPVMPKAARSNSTSFSCVA